MRGVDDSVNFGIATGALGAAVGANRRSGKHAMLFAGVFAVAGGLSDYMMRQIMSRSENKNEIHSTVDYKRFEKSDGH